MRLAGDFREEAFTRSSGSNRSRPVLSSSRLRESFPSLTFTARVYLKLKRRAPPMGYQAKSQTVGAVPDLKIEQAPQQLLVILAAADMFLQHTLQCRGSKVPTCT
jgi:hypothetical protein